MMRGNRTESFREENLPPEGNTASKDVKGGIVAQSSATFASVAA